jgi:hypothetical protein
LDTARVLADHAPLLGTGLASAGDLAALQKIAAVLPDVCHAGFECPLDTNEPGVDFLYCLRRAEESRHLLEAPPANGVWSWLRRFAAAWREGTGRLDRIPHAWLEFDLRRRLAAGVPAPSLFVNTPAMVVADYDATIAQLAGILGWVRGGATRTAMLRLHEVFGPVSAACETGFWLSRQTTTLRMVFARIEASAEAVVTLLARAGHPNPSLLLGAPLPALWPADGSVSVALDVADGVATGCAIELYPLPPGQTFPAEAHAAVQGRLFEELVCAGLCTAARKLHATGWPGGLGYGNDPRLGATLRVQRAMSHVKLSVKPGRPVAAKAYLSLSGLALKKERTADAPA